MTETSLPTFSVAPLVRYSHVHARALWRLLCPDAILYTEMITAQAFLRAKQYYEPQQEPVVLQLASDNPGDLTKAAKHAAKLGFTSINLNCGCPSERASSGGFGACMMTKPQVVASCVASMFDACDLPISVKCRSAVDDQQSSKLIEDFISPIADAGCQTFVIHVRKALLKGLSPRQNRTRPELEPQIAIDIKQAMPKLTVISNGGIGSVAEAEQRGKDVDGVMLGRAIITNPLILDEFAIKWFNKKPIVLSEVVESYLGYCGKKLLKGEHPRRMFTPLLGLAHGKSGARKFRRSIVEASCNGDLATVRNHLCQQ